MELDCERVRERLPQAVAGDLSAAESAEVKRHLARCPACRRARGQVAAILEAARRLDAPHLSEGFSEAVMARLALEASTHGQWRRRLPVAAVAAALVMGASAALLLQRGKDRPPGGIRPAEDAAVAAFVSSLNGVTRRAGRTGADALGAFSEAGWQALTVTRTGLPWAEAPSVDAVALEAVLREGSSALAADLEAADRTLRGALRDVEAGLPWL